MAQKYCDTILIIGALAAGAVILKSNRGNDDVPAVVPDVSTIPDVPSNDARDRLIIDTDMHPQSDPDDVQTYLAQASGLDVWNVRGVVSSVPQGRASGVPFVEGIIRRLNTEVSPLYKQHQVTEDPNFYIAEIDSAYNDRIPLEIHVWGSLKSLSQALSRIENRSAKLANVTVYWVANFNRVGRAEYQQYWNNTIPFVPMFAGFYRDEEGFRGIMRSGNSQKLVEIDSIMRSSNVGQIYIDNPIPSNDSTFANKWKAGDLSLYFYSKNKMFRDNLFKRDAYGGFVADGIESERLVASDGFRDEMIRVVTRNVNRY